MRKFALLAVSVLFSMPAFAKVVTFDYTGVVGSIVDNVNGRNRNVASTSALDGSMKIGDTFHGSFSYETSIPLTSVTGDTYAYQNNPWWGNISSPASTFVIDRTGTTISSSTVAPTLFVNKGSDWSNFTVYTNSDFVPSGLYTSIYFSFYDNRPDTIAGVTPPASLNVDDFYNPSATIVYSNGGRFMMAQGLVTSLTNVSPVPEPETYSLVLAGLAFAGVAAARKRRAS